MFRNQRIIKSNVIYDDRLKDDRERVHIHLLILLAHGGHEPLCDSERSWRVQVLLSDSLIRRNSFLLIGVGKSRSDRRTLKKAHQPKGSFSHIF